MGIGGALMQDPRFRERIKDKQKTDNGVTKQQQETAASIRNFGFHGMFATPQAREQMNNALRVRRSELSPSAARRMNRSN
jgi:hypothetical protein